MGRGDILCGRVGTSFQAKYWYSLDACGLVGIMISYGVHFYALIVIAFKLLSNSYASVFLYVMVYVPTAVLALWSLWMASTTDPGAVPLGARPLVLVRRATSSTLAGSPSPAPRSNGSPLLSSSDPLSSATTTNTATAPLSNNSRSSTTNSSGSTNHGHNNNGHHSNIKNRGISPARSHPGYGPVPLTATTPVTPPRALRRCHKCQDNYKPARAHHDSVTGRCIVKFDHFCPWVNNAVGALNHKFFCLFLLYTAACCVVALALLLMRVFHCGYIYDDDGTEEKRQQASEPPAAASSSSSSWGSLHGEHHRLRALTKNHLVFEECQDFYESYLVLGLLMASLVFLIFTVSMSCEQLEAIETGKGKIARMKMRVGQAGTEFARVTEEFNEMFGGQHPHMDWHWFYPWRTVQFPRGMKKVVLGYEWDPSVEPVPYQEPGSTTTTNTAPPDRSHRVSADPTNAPVSRHDPRHGEEDVETGTLRTLDPSATTLNRGNISATTTTTASSSSSSSSDSLEGSHGVVKNRKLYTSSSSREEAGLTMVERSTSRLT